MRILLRVLGYVLAFIGVGALMPLFGSSFGSLWAAGLNTALLIGIFIVFGGAGMFLLDRTGGIFKRKEGDL
jgi:hypothetical protein